MATEVGFFADRFDQGQFKAGIKDLERQSRKTGPGADVDQAGGGDILPGQDTGERIQEMLGVDAGFFTDGGQVEFLIPLKQFTGVDLESAELFLGEADAEEGMCLQR